MMARVSSTDSSVSTVKPTISLRLHPELVREFRIEGARRGKHLNALFEEMWQLYKETRDGAL